jgi:heme-degrading monooxygenase HmoA
MGLGNARQAAQYLSIERFESLYEPGKILSLSFFRDQAAVEQWRRLEAHRIAQAVDEQACFVTTGCALPA